MKNGNEFIVVQASDPHIADTDYVRNVDVLKNLEIVCSDIQLLDPGLVIFTGDISDDGSVLSYKNFQQLIKRLLPNSQVIYGNHDDKNTFKQYLETLTLGAFYNVPFSTWSFVFLDTVLPGSIEGYVSEVELQRVLKVCDTLKDRKICLVSHHHLYPVGTLAIDKYITTNGTEVLNALDFVKVHISGHVHNSYHSTYKNIELFSAPSMAFQFKKNSNGIELERNIGYNIYKIVNNHLTHLTRWINT